MKHQLLSEQFVVRAFRRSAGSALGMFASLPGAEERSLPLERGILPS
jgi:hypothetical protein